MYEPTLHECGFSARTTRARPDGSAFALGEARTVKTIRRTQQAWRILVAYDGSPSARRALDRAASLHSGGSDLGRIHVDDHGQEPDGHLEEARRLLAARGIDAELIGAAGSPAHAICVTAERDGYDMIVVGRRNLRDAGLLLLGSVSARVVAGAACDVVVVA
jgi:nucleotide-binding universal stress UspA family protein